MSKPLPKQLHLPGKGTPKIRSYEAENRSAALRILDHPQKFPPDSLPARWAREFMEGSGDEKR